MIQLLYLKLLQFLRHRRREVLFPLFACLIQWFLKHPFDLQANGKKCFVSALLVPVCLAVCVMFMGLNLKIFADIGQKTDYSYSLYLVHYPLAMCFVSLGVFGKMPGFAIFGVLGTSFLCAYMLESFQRKFFGIKRSGEAVK